MSPDSEKKLLPLFPLPLVLFPGMSLPLHIFEMRYRRMIGDCIQKDAPFGLVLSRDSEPAKVGCTARVVEVVRRFESGEFDVLTRGEKKFEVLEFNRDEDFLQARVSYLLEPPPIDLEAEAAQKDRLLVRIVDACRPLIRDPELLSKVLEFPPDLVELPSYALVQRFGFDTTFLQKVLETEKENDRLETIAIHLESLLLKRKTGMTPPHQFGGNGTPYRNGKSH